MLIFAIMKSKNTSLSYLRHSLRLFAGLMAFVLGTGLAHARTEETFDHPKKSATATVQSEPSGEKIVKTALQYLGARYRSGQSSPKGFDCSGFTSYVYKRSDIQLTRSSRSQYQEGTPVKQISDLRKGDLVFFRGSRNGHNVGHVGIVTDVADNGRSFKFIHAARTGVQINSSASAYYSRRYIGARRILTE